LKKIQETITTPPVEVTEERERKRSRTPQPELSPPKELVAPVRAVEKAPIVEAAKPVVEASKPVVEAAKPVVATKDDSPAPTKKKEVEKRRRK
jgi:hypothetical protein